MTVALGTSNSKFSAALNSEGDIAVSGTVKGGAPFLTSVGNFDVDLVIEVGLALHPCMPSLHFVNLVAAASMSIAEEVCFQNHIMKP